MPDGGWPFHLFHCQERSRTKRPMSKVLSGSEFAMSCLPESAGCSTPSVPCSADFVSMWTNSPVQSYGSLTPAWRRPHRSELHSLRPSGSGNPLLVRRWPRSSRHVPPCEPSPGSQAQPAVACILGKPWRLKHTPVQDFARSDFYGENRGVLVNIAHLIFGPYMCSMPSKQLKTQFLSRNPIDSQYFGTSGKYRDRSGPVTPLPASSRTKTQTVFRRPLFRAPLHRLRTS